MARSKPRAMSAENWLSALGVAAQTGEPGFARFAVFVSAHADLVELRISDHSGASTLGVADGAGQPLRPWLTLAAPPTIVPVTPQRLSGPIDTLFGAEPGVALDVIGLQQFPGLVARLTYRNPPGLALEVVALRVQIAAALLLPASSDDCTESAPARELRGLADVQRSLLPDQPVIRGLRYAIHYQPAEVAGGDYYDLMVLSHHLTELDVQGADVFGCMVADVSGHGASAAMEAVQFDAILRTYKPTDRHGGPAAMLSYANRFFLSRRSRGHFLTAFALICLPHQHLLRVTNAGHPPALLCRSGVVTRIAEGLDIPLGVLREHTFASIDVSIQPGDTLVLYTDGIIEANDAQHQPFGLAHLEALCADAPDDPMVLRDRIITAVHQHQGGPIGRDDQTLLVLKIGA